MRKADTINVKRSLKQCQQTPPRLISKPRGADQLMEATGSLSNIPSLRALLETRLWEREKQNMFNQFHLKTLAA